AIAASGAVLPAAGTAFLALAIGAAAITGFRRSLRQHALATADRAAADLRREDAQRQVHSHALPADPGELRRLATRIEHSQRQRLVRQQWEQQWRLLAEQVSTS